jgi:tetratricopeptide (TPR) repeat protein
MSKENKAQKLMDAGFEAIENFDHKKALKIGSKLKNMRHSSAFEILALAYYEKDEISKAVDILTEGVGVAPDVWRLWQLLGNYQSELDLFERAHKSYQKARECPHSDINSISYNSSLAYLKEGKYAEAKNEYKFIDFNKLKDEENFELLILASSLLVDIKNKLGEFEEAATVFNSLYRQKIDFESFNEATSQLISSHAETLWKTGYSEKALKCLWEAVALDKKKEKASWLIREIEGKYSTESKYFRVLIEGKWPQPFEGESKRPGFYTSYDVVADSIEDAITYIKRFEPKETEDTIKVEEFKILESSPDNPQGIYDAGGYAFFTE